MSPSRWEPDPWWLARDDFDAEVWRRRKTDPAFDAAWRAANRSASWRAWQAARRWLYGPRWPLLLAVLGVVTCAATFGLLVLLDVPL